MEVPSNQENLAAIFAARSDQITIEMPLPDKKTGTVHGLLTYTLVKCLTESKAPMTYVELVQRIRRQYAALDGSSPNTARGGR